MLFFQTFQKYEREPERIHAGDEWEKHLGVTEDRLEVWNNRMAEERKRLKGQVIENRKIYYSDFYDLKTIITKNWDLFSDCFSDRKIMEYQFSQLESFRNPNAHNRDLLEYQKHLLAGYAGEIKNGIMKYRGSIEKQSTFFPEYESLNINGIIYRQHWAHLDEIFRPGDEIEITIYVSSPNTQKVYYMISGENKNEEVWSENNHFKILVGDNNFGRIKKTIYFKSDSNYHMNGEWDGLVSISYIVVPN